MRCSTVMPSSTRKQRHDRISGYPNLEALAHLAKREGDIYGCLTANKVKTKIRLMDTHEHARKRFISRLTECNQALRTLLPAKTTSGLDYLELYEGWNNFTVYSDRRRSLMDRLYQIMSSSWNPEHQGISYTMRMLLDPHPRLETHHETQLDVWFCDSPSSSTDRWQEADLLVCDESFIRGAISPDFKGILGTSSAESSFKAKPKTARKEPNILESGGILKLIRESSELPGTRRLEFAVKQDKLHFIRATESLFKDTIPTFEQLQAFLLPQPASILGQQKAKARYVLSFIMASSFLQLHESSWCHHWTKEQIVFATSQQRGCDFSKPYIVSTLGRVRLPMSETEMSKARLRKHPYPGILALGIMLLQIWLGKSIEEFRPSDNANNSATSQSYDIELDIEVARNLLFSCKDDALEMFRVAVDACLDTERLTPGQSLSNKTFREEVYKKIVFPLELCVTWSYGIRLGEKDSLRSVYEINPPSERPQRSNEAVERIAVMADPNTPMRDRSSIPKQIKLKVNSYDASQWMERTEACLESFLQQQEVAPPFVNKVLGRPGAVRIAILDTGIDLPPAAVFAFGDRVKRYKDWTKDGREGVPWKGIKPEDAEGHGTHAAALILKMAPLAEVYIARVFPEAEKGNIRHDTRNESTAESNSWVGLAIDHAVHKWKVDIISMSFGFERSSEVIDKVITNLSGRDVIMFAAAGNDGGNSDPPYPGRLSNVIAIHAADPMGNKAAFTADRQSKMDNFMFPGTNVESSWPPHLKQGARMKKSGTSCATPLAAALAANILGIAGFEFHKDLEARTSHPGDEEQWKKLRSYRGMCLALREMSGDRDRYQYTTPWSFLPPGNRKLETAMDILVNKLTKEM